MSKPRGLIWKTAALVVLLAGAVFILGSGQPPTEMVSAQQPASTDSPTHQPPTSTPLSVVALLPTSLPPTPRPTETLVPAPATQTVVPVQEIAFQAETVQPAPPLEQATAVPASPVRPVPNQVTIQFAPGTTAAQQRAYVAQLGGTIEQSIAPLNVLVVTLPDATTAQALPPSSLVVQTEPDFYVTAQQTTPNDFYYSQQWALPVIQAPEAWPLLPANAPTVVVAVIDSGICAGHLDLAGKILPGYDFVQGDTTPQDEYGHGCGVSGIIAANTNNNFGIAGIAPNARIMPVRVLDAVGNGTYSNVIAGIIYAADHGAQIINLSLGGAVPSTTMQEAVDYAVERGVLMIAAAGNYTHGEVVKPVMYPAAYPNVIAVASVDSDLQPSSFSAVGPEIDLYAPGRDIMTTRPDGSHMMQNGTSFAAPQVAGIAALEIGRGKSFTQTGGIVHADIPAPEPTPIPTMESPEHSEIQPVPTDTWAVILEAGSDPDEVAIELGYENLGQIANLSDTYLFRIPNSSTSTQASQGVANTLDADTRILSFQQQFMQQESLRDPEDDPLYQMTEQWHLHNGSGWVSLNMPNGWLSGEQNGSGVQIAIVDDGLQYTHRDLAPNYSAADSYDFNGNDLTGMSPDNDPAPNAFPYQACGGSSSNCHGTAAAGVAAAADNPAQSEINADWDYCGVGVAYGANLAGIRLVAAGSSDAMKANALTYHTNANDIYSNSWGPFDYGNILEGPGSLTKAAMAQAVITGRNGLGSIYVWAAGNGRTNGDNINADGYANSRFVIAVGAVDYTGKYAYYSEPGAPMLVTAPSSGTTVGISTTDLYGHAGYNIDGTSENYLPWLGEDYNFGAGGGDSGNFSCTKKFTGTSATTPMVAGVIALMLQANPNLTWRDVQYILVNTARQNDAPNSDWQTNGAGKLINHNYGFGLVDAAAAVTAAQTWTNVAPEVSAASPVVTVNASIPDNNATGITSTVNFESNINVEHVEIVFNASHEARGNLAITLMSPDGTQSRLMEQHNDTNDDYTNWTFTTVRNWGEHSAGIWTLRVADMQASEIGTFQSWQLKVYGTAAPPKQPVPLTPASSTTFSTSLPWNPTTFAWNVNRVAADHLELKLSKLDEPVGESIITIPGTPSSYVMNLPLGEYEWRIRAVDADPATLEPDWEAVPARLLTITTTANQPPARNYFTTGAPVLSWTYLGWATAYQVEISTSPKFEPAAQVYISPDGTGTEPAIPKTDQSFTVDPPLAEGIYYWRVRGRKADNTWSTTWSVYDSFIIDLP